MSRNHNNKIIIDLKDRENKTHSVISSDIKSTFIHSKPYTINFNHRKTMSERVKSEILSYHKPVESSSSLYNDFRLAISPEFLQIKEILKNDKNLKEEKSRSRFSRIAKIKSYHTNRLNEDFNTYKSLFLTGKFEEQEKESENRILNVTPSSKELKNNEKDDKNLLFQNNNNSQSTLKEPDVGFKTFYPHIGNIRISKNEGIRDYVSSTFNNSRMKYIIKIKEEQFIREGETYNNKIEAIKDQYLSLVRTKDFFDNKFIGNFETWVKYLNKEKEDLLALKELDLKKRREIEAEIRQYENKLMRMKEKLNQYYEYRNFLICVKEKRLNQIGKKKDSIKIPIKRFKHSSESIALFKKSSLINDFASKSVNLFIASKKYSNKHIFDSPNQIIEEFRILQSENLEKMEILTYLLNKNQEQKEIEKNEDTLKDEKKLIDEKIKILEKLKEKNIDLIEEKEKLKKIIEIKVKSEKKSILKFKINQIYIVCKDHSITQFPKKENVNSLINSKNINLLSLIENKISDFERLAYIEKNMNLMVTKYLFYLENNPQDIKNYEKEKEADRKRKAGIELRYEKENKKQKLFQKIVERYRKVYSLPRRKVAVRYKPKEKKLQVFTRKEESIIFEDFLSYE